jgi:hypothetical protein
MIGSKDLREEVEEGDIVADEPALEKGSLLWSEHRVEDPSHPSSKDPRQASVVCVKEGNRSVVGCKRDVPSLIDRCYNPIKEARWDVASLSDGREQFGEEVKKCCPTPFPKFGGKTVQAWGFSRSSCCCCVPYFPD